jgi:NDP-sugar pyrophosphorylase family protein
MSSVDGPARLVGVVMAGGAGERMRRSGEDVPKPMVTVLGIPLVEWNVLALQRAGITDVAIVVAASGAAADQVRAWAGSRGQVMAEASGGRLAVVVEPSPMGNAGALTLAVAKEGTRRTAVLVFADNLTALDLGGLVSVHRARAADLTLAVHEESFRLPYGVVDHDEGVVTGYREKPLTGVQVGSGIAVVGPRALAMLADLERPVGIVDLVRGAVAAGLDVRAEPHASAWVDVNDAESRQRAEALVRADAAAFGYPPVEPA